MKIMQMDGRYLHLNKLFGKFKNSQDFLFNTKTIALKFFERLIELKKKKKNKMVDITE